MFRFPSFRVEITEVPAGGEAPRLALGLRSASAPHAVEVADALDALAELVEQGGSPTAVAGLVPTPSRLTQGAIMASSLATVLTLFN